jgi:hypothetical protein
MVKVKISLGDQLVRWARVQAAEEGTSAPRLIAKVLRREMERQKEYDRAMNRWLASNRDSDDESEK